jgi:hypothetical protein
VQRRGAGSARPGRPASAGSSQTAVLAAKPSKPGARGCRSHRLPLKTAGQVFTKSSSIPPPDFDPREATAAQWAAYNAKQTLEQKAASCHIWFWHIVRLFGRSNNERRAEAEAFAVSRRLAIKRAFWEGRSKSDILARLAADFGRSGPVCRGARKREGFPHLARGRALQNRLDLQAEQLGSRRRPPQAGRASCDA